MIYFNEMDIKDLEDTDKVDLEEKQVETKGEEAVDEQQDSNYNKKKDSR